MYYAGFSYREAYTLPIWQRIWFIDRINEEFKRAAEQNANASRAAHHNTPDERMMSGRARTAVPANLRRFT